MSEKQVRVITEKLKKLARERDTNYAHILTQFLIERAVARLTTKPMLRDHLVFKGGFVGLSVYGSPRYTIDLDAVSFEKSSSEILRAAKKAMETKSGDGVWFAFQEQIDLATQK